MPVNDDATAEALRSNVGLVVVEAPAGCGKTFQGTTYAADASKTLTHGRVLVLAHTHAATDVFMHRTPQSRDKVDVRTIDSLAFGIARAYHRSVDLPADPTTWGLLGIGFDEVASRVVGLLNASPMIETMLAERYPIVICDEHQDSSDAQHAIVMALRRAGAKLRIFGDPMQKLYGGNVGKTRLVADQQRWDSLHADSVATKLSHPHRWENAPALGEWILNARTVLQNGGVIDLTRDLPSEVQVIRAENVGHGKTYRLDSDGRKQVTTFADQVASLFILCAQNDTAQCVSATLGRRYKIWEGHTRDSLAVLASSLTRDTGNPTALGRAAAAFLVAVTTGFTPKGHAEPLCREIEEGCSATRSGFPGELQRLAQRLLAEPNHRGVAHLLADVSGLISSHKAFQSIHVDFPTEMHEAISLGSYDDPSQALLDISRRRTALRPMPRRKSISTVHKAKGLEQDGVLIVPCDKNSFSTTTPARHKLYVALSRATRKLAIVVPEKDRSPLLHV